VKAKKITEKIKILEGKKNEIYYQFVNDSWIIYKKVIHMRNYFRVYAS